MEGEGQYPKAQVAGTRLKSQMVVYVSYDQHTHSHSQSYTVTHSHAHARTRQMSHLTKHYWKD
eukprot:1001923-Amphidinium_carterae.2